MSAPLLFSHSSPAVRRLHLLELPVGPRCGKVSGSKSPQVMRLFLARHRYLQRQIRTSQEPTASPTLRGRPAPSAPLVTTSIGGCHSLRSAKRGWSSSVLLVHPGAGVAGVPLALYVSASSVQSFEPCHSASTFTRAPGRPWVRRGFWLQVLPSQAAFPHATLLSLAADQHFSRADSVLHAQGQARSLRSACYDLNSRLSPAIRRLRLLELPVGLRCGGVFWLQVPPSQAALPHATPLSLAADQHFSGANFTLAGLCFYG
ncbi:hypothetical protein NDU88_006149 [Pleurodeles waltl]|uniref:Uncharacterized protein n=1 Tax=Pleurodeles waltl TaxID=8319 RepID=A0AAV7ULK4_PLEWA|nr:hypothetical protein NDU88_006149 [Pleurodeles waltl]